MRVIGWALMAVVCRPPPAPLGEPVKQGRREVPEEDVLHHRSMMGKGTEVRPGVGPLPPFEGVDRTTARYVGGERCATCHAAEAEVWVKTAHARAYRTLERAHAGHDPTCVPCHVVGAGHPGGWDGEERLAHVGCEACHGPGSDHVAAPGPGYGRLPAGDAACVGCHTLDTSPDFRWAMRWPKVAHGR